MTDKKPNNNDIIKALDICSKSTNGCSHSKYTCEDCYLNGQPMCSSVLLQDAIDLHTRQQAEIERLQKEVNLVSMQFQDIQERQEESQAEIDKLNAENMLTMSERNAFRTSFYDVLKQLKTAKSEAVKEFAERVKEFMHNKFKTLDEYEFEYITESDIGNLLKEMVGENNATT